MKEFYTAEEFFRGDDIRDRENDPIEQKKYEITKAEETRNNAKNSLRYFEAQEDEDGIGFFSRMVDSVNEQLKELKNELAELERATKEKEQIKHELQTEQSREQEQKRKGKGRL